MQVKFGNQVYDVEVIKKNNRNMYLRVRDGKIVITANYLTSKSTILKFINDNEKGIIKMIEKDLKKQEKKDNFYYFGKKYDVVYGFSNMDITEDKIYVKDEKSLDKVIDKNIHKIYQEHLDYWYNKFEERIPIPSLRIRKMTSRWGVCNIKTKVITLNYMLYKYDISCLDYVIVHELSHLIHHNHSKDFWLLVEKYYPKYKECRRLLKE